MPSSNVCGWERKKANRYRMDAARRQKWRCLWCSKGMQAPPKKGRAPHVAGTIVPLNRLTAEHVIPRSKGGRTIPENIFAACHRCNSKRGSGGAESDRTWRPPKPLCPAIFDLFHDLPETIQCNDPTSSRSLACNPL
jgi:5-methylcytosine-specific restriction endonuclease McrA